MSPDTRPTTASPSPASTRSKRLRSPRRNRILRTGSPMRGICRMYLLCRRVLLHYTRLASVVAGDGRCSTAPCGRICSAKPWNRPAHRRGERVQPPRFLKQRSFPASPQSGPSTVRPNGYRSSVTDRLRQCCRQSHHSMTPTEQEDSGNPIGVRRGTSDRPIAPRHFPRCRFNLPHLVVLALRRARQATSSHS